MNDFTYAVILSPAPEWLIDSVILRQRESEVLYRITYVCARDEWCSRPVRDYSQRFLQAGLDLFKRWMP